LERVLKPLSNRCLGIIIKINLTTNYQLLLNRNKVHRADAAQIIHVHKIIFFCTASVTVTSVHPKQQ
jgi:hypothetical protein